MFAIPLVVTLLLAMAVSFLVARFFNAPLAGILKRIIADDISSAWLKYMKFAILVVGVSNGVRVRELDRYMLARGERTGPAFDFSIERWTVELYRTAIETLQGITWMLLVFFVFAMIAYVIVRIAELKFGPAKNWSKPDRLQESAASDDA